MATNGNNVNITLTASDKASGVFKGLTGLIEGATLKANLLSEALSAGLSKGVSALTAKFKEAADIQLNNLSAAATYAALTGRSFTDAESVISKISSSIDKYAGPLPGVAQKYKDITFAIQDDLIPAFTNLNGVLDEGKFLDKLSNITKGLGVISESSKVDSQHTSDFAAKLLQGESESQLRRLEFGQRNPAFLGLYQKSLESFGTTIEKSTRVQRAAALELTTNKLVTPELISKSSNSVSGLIGNLQDKLFSPTRGVFGILKELNSGATGNKTVLDAFNETLKIIVGDNGLFDTIGKLLNKLGVDPDFILKTLKGGIENFNNFLSNLNTTLTSIDSSNLFDFKKLGYKLGGLFNEGIIYLQRLNLKLLVDNLSQHLTSSFNELVTFFETINYRNIAKLLSNSLLDLFQGISTFLISNDWGSRLGTIVNDAFKALGKLDWGNIFSGLGVVLANVLNTVLKFLEKLDTGAIFDTVISIIGGMFKGLGVFLANIDWTSVIEVFKKAFTAPIDILGKKIGNVIDEITYFLDNFINKLTGRDDQSAKNQKVADIQSDSTLDNLQKARKIREIDHPTVTSKLNNYANGLNVGSLMSAISREQKAAPAGAGIVIANSTEAILNRQQQSQLASSVVRGGGLNIGSIVIHAATNPEETAEAVMQRIADKWNNYNQNNLATAI